MQPVPNPPRDWAALRPVFVIGAILVVVAYAVLSGGRTPSPAPTGGNSDAAIKAEMTKNLQGIAGVRQPPDVAVRDGVLFVVTDDPSNATLVCSTVAAFTNSGDTAEPLGVIGVIVIAGGQTLADCRP